MNGGVTIVWGFTALLLLFSASCGERKTEVRLEGGNPPRFVMSGSGRLVELSVGLNVQDKSIKPSERSPLVWKIVPTGRYGEEVESVDSVTYGVVPEGYRQVIPASDNQPPPLNPGNYYYYYLETLNAPHADGDFEIRDGKPVGVSGVKVCYKTVDGREVETKCNDQ